MPQLSEAQREARALYEQDFFAFCDDLMQPWQFGKSALSEDLHKPLCDWLQAIWDEDKTYSVLEIPRGCFKSTIGTVYFTLWNLARQPNLRILVTHGKLETAKDFFRAIKHHMDGNPLLRRLWPDVFWENGREDSNLWLSDKLNVRRTVNDPVPSVMVASPEATVVGKHFHLHIWDDLSTDSNSVTEGQREKVKAWCREQQNTIRPPDAVVPSGGRVLDIGTPWHFDDCHAMLLSGDYESETRSLIKGHYGEPGKTSGTPIFPERFDDAEIQRRAKKMGSRQAAAQLFCSPNAGDDGIFTSGDLRWYAPGHYPGNTISGKTIPGRIRIFMSADPNRSEKTQHDPMAIIVAGMDERGHIWVLDKFRGHPSGSEVLDVTTTFAQRWNPESVFWEETNAQLQILKMVREKFMEEGVHIRVVPIVRGNTKKFERISAMQALVESGGLHLRRGVDEDIESEATQYPYGKHDDMLDALADIYAYGKRPLPEAKEELPKNPYTLEAMLKRHLLTAGPENRGPSFAPTSRWGAFR